ncbi:MAG: hypothetical protein U1E46_17525 [Hyphomicrobiales bacterium]
MPLLTSRNLILVYDRVRQGLDDFKEIARRIVASAPDVRVFIVRTEDSAVRSIPPEAWNSPTLTVAFGPLVAFRPPRGAVALSEPIEKLEQYRRFLTHGVGTPRSAPYRFGMALDEVEWGPFVLLKPTDLTQTSHGSFIQVFRTQRARMLSAADFAPDHPVHVGGMMVQQFIDTGKYPCRTRVMTLFGEPLHTQLARLQKPRPPLSASDADLAEAVVATNALQASGADDRVLVPDGRPQILAFARKVGAAFPDRPLLGIDIVEEAESGALYALEVNAGGNVWHFSSPTWASVRETFPNARTDMLNEFGAFDVAAKVLVKVTRQRAR